MNNKYPRVVIAGLGGDSGKTFISCGIMAHLKGLSANPIPFKKGPDYIDPQWLGLASGRLCRNLDTYMIGTAKTKETFFGNLNTDGIAIVEGNRGLFDGLDAEGKHSTAELAKLLGAAVILVLDGSKVTRTLAAIALGCQAMDSQLRIGGIILNKVSGKRHAKVAVESIKNATGIDVIGIIPTLDIDNPLPSRHLGLVTPDENELALEAVGTASEVIRDNVDFEKFLEIANMIDEVEIPMISTEDDTVTVVKIGYFRDRAFSFYYPENIEALRQAGAEIIGISAVEDNELGDIDGLYIGGGFPETNLEQLNLNVSMRESVRKASEKGMPVYAECGGLMYLCDRIIADGESKQMAGVLPFSVKLNKKPQGHGYVNAICNRENPFFSIGDEIIGHEFHYSSIVELSRDMKMCFKLNRGTGAKEYRDGFLINNTFASYFHIHAHNAVSWANNFFQSALKYKANN